MKGKSCLVVLIGTSTAGRRWVNHEITKAWNDGKGVLGIYIHNLKNLAGQQSLKGSNPFTGQTIKASGVFSGPSSRHTTRPSATAKRSTITSKRTSRVGWSRLSRSATTSPPEESRWHAACSTVLTTSATGSVSSRSSRSGRSAGQPLLSSNRWEEVTGGSDRGIKRWIDEQMERKSCAVVLIG